MSKSLVNIANRKSNFFWMEAGLPLSLILFLLLSSQDFQLTLEQFREDSETTGMRINTSKSRADCWKMRECTLQVWVRPCPCFSLGGRLCEIHRWIGVTSAIICCSDESPEPKGKALFTCWSMLWTSPMVTNCVVTKRTRMWIKATEIIFLYRVAELSLRDRVKPCH